MPAAERPSLRPFLAAAPDRRDPRYLVIWDQLGFTRQTVRVTRHELVWAQLFDGRRSLHEIHADANSPSDGPPPTLDSLSALAERLDAALFLDGPRFRQRLDGPVREPSCLGVYEPDPDALRRRLAGYFTGPGGPGMPRHRSPDGRLRAALIPHIDYRRGGTSYARAFKELVEHTDASLFVIVGTSHYSPERYTLTRKDFKTPLGVARTDQTYIDRLSAHYGPGLFADPIAHLPEHSIELEVVFLQYLYEGRRPFRIVPLVVGSFEDCVRKGTEPAAQPDVGRMVRALRAAEDQAGEPVCYIISGDLAHLGPKFGDPAPVAEPLLAHSRAQDQSLLSRAEAADPAGFFRAVAAEGDRRRICGLPPLYTVLEATHPACGKGLHYAQYVHPRGHESVSFAGVAFYR